MKMPKFVPALAAAAAAAALLAACEARFGNDAAEIDVNATAAGRAEEGRLTIEAPGFNMQIDIPEAIEARAEIERDGIVYPGSQFGGLHVQGRPGGPEGGREGEVELRFTSGDPPGRVAAWYRDPAREADLAVESAGREGGAYVVSGTDRRDGDHFTVRITPRPGGGSEARLLIGRR